MIESGSRETAASVIWPSPTRAWWAVAVFTVAAVLSYTDRQILSLLVDPIRSELQITDTQISLLQGAAFAIVYAFVGLPLGRLADILPRRRLLMGGIFIWTMATVACGFSGSFLGLIVARIFVGIGEATLAPTSISMIGDLFPPHRRGTVIGILWMGTVIGGGAALGIGGGLLHAAETGAFEGVPFLDSLVPWRATLVALGIPGLALILLLSLVKEPVRREQNSGSSSDRYSVSQVIEQLFAQGGLVLTLLVAGALVSIIDFSLMNWAPALLSRNYHFSPEKIGAVLGTMVVISGAAGALGGGAISDLLARRGGIRSRVMGCAAVATFGLPLVAISLTNQAWQIIALLTWWNFFSAAIGTMQVTALQEIVPNKMRGSIMSFIAFGNILIGLGLGTTVTALLTDKLFADPLSIAFSLGAVAAPAGISACLLFWFALSKTDKPVAPIN